MKNAFRKNSVEQGYPTPILTGEQVWERVQNFPKVAKEQPYKFDGYGVAHNWTKQSIFWELPYWKDNLLRHNLDVMHIEKNYFDNLFNTEGQKIMLKLGWTYLNIAGEKSYGCKRNRTTSSSSLRLVIHLQGIKSVKFVNGSSNLRCLLDMLQI